jgi:hypothetical protein
VDEEAPKLVRVPAWRGIIGYWGLAQHEPRWNTLHWLRAEAGRAHQYASAATFARHLSDALTAALQALPFDAPQDGGLGLHCTAYERVGDYWVPELFLVTNWTDASYTAIRPEGFRVTRETYATLRGLAERVEAHGEQARRLEVHDALRDQAVMFRFVNGDPVLFNPVANAVLDSFIRLGSRGELNDGTSARTHLALVRRPVELVSHLVRDFAAPGRRRVGGRPHDLAVSPGGIYESSTGA